MNDILNAVGIGSIPPGESEASLLHKILTSQVVYNRVMEYLVATHAADVIKAMPAIERNALRNRLVPPAPGKLPVLWEVVQPSRSTNGQMTVVASHGDKEVMRFNGDWHKVREVVFFGERIPAEIAAIYELNFNTPRMDPEAATIIRQRERETLEAAMARQNNTGDAALANEALSRLPKF